MKFEHTPGLFFALTAAACLILFSLGRKWGREFEASSTGFTFYNGTRLRLRSCSRTSTKMQA